MTSERKIYRNLVGVDEVLKIIESYRRLEPLGEEEVPLEESVGRVLSRNVYSLIDYPPYTRALVDGYAVLSSDLVGVYEDRPKTLKLVGKLSTGETRVPHISSGETVEVSTGAIVPYPADAVVPVEYTHASGDKVTFYRSVSHGENVDTAGSDIARGEVVAWKGELVTPLLVSSLAATGLKTVWVYRQARVGIIPTGNEIKYPGERLEYGQIYDSNSHMIYAFMKLLGAKPKIYERALDDPSQIGEYIDRALEENDVVVTIGGTSAGLEDYTYRAMSRLKPGIIIHGVREKPGRPLVVALHGDKILLGLPGFPMSCMQTVYLYLIPIVSKLQGLREHSIEAVRAELALPLRNEPGIRSFIPVILVQKYSGMKVFPLPGHSGRVSLISLFDGFAVLREDQEYLPAGSMVEVLLNPFSRRPEVNIIGSHDPLLQEVVSETLGASARLVNVGSTGGLQAVKSGIADIAGSHLLDPATNEYNIPYVKSYGIDKVILIRGYLREQGLVYRKEKEPVRSISEVIDKGLSFVNRNPGSGTRVLIDKLLEDEAARRGITSSKLKAQLKGYTFEVKTHEAVAHIVASGVADVGVALRYVAIKYGLGFTSLAWERYDLIVSKESLQKPKVARLLERVKSLKGEDIEKFPGYRVDGETGKEYEF
ncbi:MAG: molybdopterin biosynthesis protein [Infirmifilum sp.]|uniref:molybdopterin biosynthesis protein n=1 Tax=Infirmifilum sp. TaxID=2856575 RepID=UPI00235429BB